MNSFQADGSYVSSLAGLESNGSQKAQNQLLQIWDWDPAAGQTHHQASLFGGGAATALPYNLLPMGIGGGGYPFLSVLAEDYPVSLIKNEEDRAAGQIGLNLGRRTYFPSGEAAAIEQLFRRSRGIYQSSQQAARCQAEGCKADLSIAKHYHRRHKVCELHSKATVVVAGGTQQRFCQQCSRFHLLSEFDEAKRSCRKRLAEHNRRRRKSQSSPTISAPTNYPGNSMDRLRHPSNDPSRNIGAEQVNPLPGTSASTISGMSQSNTNMDENKAMAQLWNGPSLSLGGSSADGATPGKGHNYGFPSPYQSQIPSWVFVSDENNNGNSASQRSSSSSSSMFHHSQALFCDAAAEGSHAATAVTEANLLQLGQGLLEVDFL